MLIQKCMFKMSETSLSINVKSKRLVIESPVIRKKYDSISYTAKEQQQNQFDYMTISKNSKYYPTKTRTNFKGFAKTFDRSQKVEKSQLNQHRNSYLTKMIQNHCNKSLGDQLNHSFVSNNKSIPQRLKPILNQRKLINLAAKPRDVSHKNSSNLCIDTRNLFYNKEVKIVPKQRNKIVGKRKLRLNLHSPMSKSSMSSILKK
mmetsp:Transcript_3686/g.3102  ORF Transcript_3686/g.3102 Transcript_3686/m.3102 type:complete len:203 (+) Transcript_3686:87-695(+)